MLFLLKKHADKLESQMGCFTYTSVFNVKSCQTSLFRTAAVVNYMTYCIHLRFWYSATPRHLKEPIIMTMNINNYHLVQWCLAEVVWDSQLVLISYKWIASKVNMFLHYDLFCWLLKKQ